jgi:hypothetical protein
MAKKLGKSEKLDLILSELSALRADVKTLRKEGARGAKPVSSARARPAPAKKPAKKAAKRSEAPRKPVKAKPVLVETDDEEPRPQPASRIA